MIPQQLIEMEVMPLTLNGKIDRKALPDLNQTYNENSENVEPNTATELKLAEIWNTVIGINKINLDHSFFDIGGHSLLSIQVIAQIEQEFGVRLKAAVMVLNTFEQIAGMLPVTDTIEDNPPNKDNSDMELEEKASADIRKGSFIKRFFRRK